MPSDPSRPTPDEEAELLHLLANKVRPSNYRLRCFYDQLVSLPTSIEDYEPRLWDNPVVPREVLRAK